MQVCPHILHPVPPSPPPPLPPLHAAHSSTTALMSPFTTAHRPPSSSEEGNAVALHETQSAPHRTNPLLHLRTSQGKAAFRGSARLSPPLWLSGTHTWETDRSVYAGKTTSVEVLRSAIMHLGRGGVDVRLRPRSSARAGRDHFLSTWVKTDPAHNLGRPGQGHGHIRTYCRS